VTALITAAKETSSFTPVKVLEIIRLCSVFYMESIQLSSV